MPLHIAIQMDAISDIDIAGDSSFALLLEAQARGHEIFYYTPENLVLDGGHARARGASLRVTDKAGAHFKLGDMRSQNLAECDVVLLRQDPPFNMAYITTTYILERIHPKTLVVNDPSQVRNAPEKLFVFDYQHLMPPTLVTRALEDTRAFQVEHDDIIIKPLYGNGGASVFRLKPDDTNLAALVEVLQEMAPEPFVVQQYRPEIKAGDKRIILVDGEIAGAINRVPPKGETRSNMHVGGMPEATKLTRRERDICAELGPDLKKRGLIFAGIDVIGDYLTEVNVTSPTGLRQIEAFDGTNIAAKIWDVVEDKLS